VASDLDSTATNDPPELTATIRGTRAGAIVLVGVAALNLGNAVFHLLAARLLGPSQYGEVVSLVAISGVISLPFGGIQVAVARFVAEDAARGDANALAALVRWVVVWTLALALAVTVVLTALSPIIQHVLGVHRLLPVVLTALYTLPALFATALWGVAQGMQRFGAISASIGIGSISRIVLMVAVIPFGLGVGGVMGATLVGAVIAVVVPFTLILRWLRHPTAGAAQPPRRELIRYAVPVIASTLAITALTNVDLIVAKVSLSSHDAGIYGSASFIGKLLLYLPTTIATVLLPKVASRAAADQDTTEILHASLAVTIGFSLFGTALLVAVPHLVIDATFGSTYSGAVPLIGLFGLAMTAYAALNVMLVYHLGHGKSGMAWLLLGGAATQIGVYGLLHGSLYQLLGVNLGTALTLVLVHELFFERTLPGTVAWAFARLRRA
jgi:O-antigen/teichoic acid export membrane protein